MGATILESLSSSKLLGVLTILLILQVISFYVGAFLTPSPSSFEQFTSVHCNRKDRKSLAIPRDHRNNNEEFSRNCDRSASEFIVDKEKFGVTTFAVQLPIPRDGIDLTYSRWMQTLLVLLIPDFQYEPSLADPSNQPVKIEDQLTLLIDVDLAVKNKGDKGWTRYASRTGLRRTIRFQSNDIRQTHKLDCDSIQLFELQSIHYDHYLINFEIRDDPKSNKTLHFPGRLREVLGVAIHYNGGFTQIWLSLKTVFFAITLATLIWYCKRLTRLNRKTILIERLLIGLGSTLTLLNVPVEFLTLYLEIPFIMFLNDLRQGIFYCVLLSFWIIFVGEHLLDGTRKNGQLASYTKELMAICVASVSLLIFDSSERGIQAMDPFLTIWESRPNLANLSITIASCACSAYLIFLLYYIYLAFRTISGKQSSLPKMQITKRLKYQGMIYRFQFLLCATTLCAIVTLVFYGLSHKHDRTHDDGFLISSSEIEWTSAMLMTVCAMWNLYVITLMILYAPSNKGLDSGLAMSDHIEFDCLTEDRDDEFVETDMKLLQALASKANLD